MEYIARYNSGELSKSRKYRLKCLSNDNLAFTSVYCIQTSLLEEIFTTQITVRIFRDLKKVSII